MVFNDSTFNSDHPFTFQQEPNVLRVCLGFLLGSHSLLVFDIFVYLLHRGQKIYLFLDGFDETPTENNSKLTRYLERLSLECKGIVVCVATRPNWKGLNNDIVSRTLSYYILPFPVTQQVHAITSIWKAKWYQHDDLKIATIARSIVSKYRNLQQPGEEDILGTPLKCYMLAMIHETTARKASNPARKSVVQLSQESSMSSLVALYVHYIEAGKTKMRHLYNEDIIRDVLDFHTFAAFNVLLPKLSDRVFAPTRLQQIISVPLSQYSLLGILVNPGHEFTDVRRTFIHRTFAEYFVARYFSQYWIQQDMNSHESKSKVSRLGRLFKQRTDQRIGNMFFEHVANAGSRSLLTKTLMDNIIKDYNEENQLEKYLKTSANMATDYLPRDTDIVRATRALISAGNNVIPQVQVASKSATRHHKHNCNGNIMRLVNNMLSGVPTKSYFKVNLNGCFRPDIYSLLSFCLENNFFFDFHSHYYNYTRHRTQG